MRFEPIQKALKIYQCINSSIKPYAATMVLSPEGIHILYDTFSLLHVCETDVDKPILIEPDIISQLKQIKNAEEIQFTPSGFSAGAKQVKADIEIYKEELVSFKDLYFGVYDAQDVKKGIDSVKFAVGDDPERRVLNNICWKDTSMVAVDGYRVALFNSINVQNEQVLLPPVVYNLLSKFITKKTNILEFGQVDQHMYIHYEDIWIKAENKDLEFLKHHSLFSKKSDAEISFYIDRKALLNSLTQMIVKDVKKYPCRLTLGNEDLILLEQSTESASIKDTIDITIMRSKKMHFEIAFNPMYMVEALKTMSDAVVEVTMVSNLTPIQLYGVDSKHLVLPIRINA